MPAALLRTTGADAPIVRAFTRTGLVPEIVPAELRGLIVRRDDDWELDRRSLLIATATEPGRQVDLVATYAAWRSSWERWWDLGATGAVEAFVATSREYADVFGLDVSGLTALDAVRGADTPVRVEGDAREKLGVAVESATDALRMSQETGWGLVDVTTGVGHGLRYAGWTDEDVDVSRVGSAVVVSRAHEGLWLFAPGTAVRLRSWEITGPPDAPATMAWQGDDENGSTVTGVLEHPDALVLASLVPGAAKVKVRDVPLTSVWAAALVGLRAACADEAGAFHLGVRPAGA